MPHLGNDCDWELAPKNAHPNARQLLTDPFFWNEIDDLAPLGSDTGSDTLSCFREWRAKYPAKSTQIFLRHLLVGWQVVDTGWLKLEEDVLRQALKVDHFSVLTQDDATIAVAFSQLVLEGDIDLKIREFAKYSIRRQLFETVISFRCWREPGLRKKRLARMLEVLENL